MPIPADFVSNLACIHPRDIAQAVASKSLPEGCAIWALGNEIKPVDLYCYLGARFGSPNGMQNFLRADHSDNLIHWEWTLSTGYGWLSIQGLNFRTELLLHGAHPFDESDKQALVVAFKADFKNYSRLMAEIRKKSLEKWVEFINPYARLKRSVDLLLKEVRTLALDPSADAIHDLLAPVDVTGAVDIETFKATMARYSRGVGMCFGIRSMLPVIAEAFINMLIFVMLRPEIKIDPRLRDNVFKQPIDVRIRSLHINCIGFQSAIDYTNKICGAYHSLVNNRNDLLHGNVAVEKLKFNEVYFSGKVPIFNEYRSMWDRSIGVEIGAVGLADLEQEVRTITDFIEYVLSCLKPKVQIEMKQVLSTRDLGLNEATQKIGILFAATLVDFRFGSKMTTANNVSHS